MMMAAATSFGLFSCGAIVRVVKFLSYTESSAIATSVGD
jgi:hypothetical protein